MATEPPIALALIAFNRPDLLRQQLEVVRRHYRGHVFAVVDGPRADRPGEAEKVAEVLEIFQQLGNELPVSLDSAGTNLGCFRRIRSGLDWVFSQADKVLILEDDCLPAADFFPFAQQMLETYASDERVYSISGSNLFPDKCAFPPSYSFSRYHNCWGWATWSRAWKWFLEDESDWLAIRPTHAFRSLFRNYRSYLYWRKIFDLTYSGRINSWAYRWMLSCWMRQGLSVLPSANLISNLGDGQDATRTAGSSQARRSTGQLCWPLQAPDQVDPNEPYDTTYEDVVFSKSMVNRLRWIIRKLVGWLPNHQ